MQQMTPEQLKEHLDQGLAPVLLDVREPWEYAIYHIGGSVNIQMSELVSAISDLDRESMTIVICHHGHRSLQVTQYLEAEGFRNVSNLEGGMDAWADSIDQTMAKY